MLQGMQHNFEFPEHIQFHRGVFSTMVWSNGNIEFWEDHLTRLVDNTKTYFQLTNVENLKERLENLIGKILGTGLYRVKVSIYPKNSFQFSQISAVNDLALAIFFEPLVLPNKEIFQVESMNMELIPKLPLVKIENYSEVLYFLRMAKLKGHDDLLYLNSEKIALRGSVSNFFGIKGTRAFIPDFNSLKVFQGITIGRVKKCLEPYFEIVTKPLSYDSIIECDAFYFTNSVIGIKAVSRLDEHEFINYKKNSEILNLWVKYKDKIHQ